MKQWSSAGWLEMRRTRARLLSGTIVCLALGLALEGKTLAWHQDVAQPASAGTELPPRAEVPQDPATLSAAPMEPTAMVERRGRLLVLTYICKYDAGESPRFAIYKGRHQIASGQFEYGPNCLEGYWRVPVTAFGDLRIVASAGFGERGRLEGSPVLYHWPWHWDLPGLGPWLLLALAIALPKTNRHRHAPLIFVPMVALGFLWRQATILTGAAYQMEVGFLIEFLAVGLALLWLNADELGRCHSVLRFVTSLAILLLGGLTVGASYWGAFSDGTGVPLVFTMIMAVASLISLTLARWSSHGRYKALRFMVWLAVWSTPCAIAGVATQVLMLLTENPTYDPQAILAEIIVPGLVLSLCLYAVNLPYMLLVFSSPFFRQRFCIWLGVAANPDAQKVGGR
jgi:hypothetical protein